MKRYISWENLSNIFEILFIKLIFKPRVDVSKNDVEVEILLSNRSLILKVQEKKYIMRELRLTRKIYGRNPWNSMKSGIIKKIYYI